MSSYTSTRIGLVPRISEALNLYRAHSQDVPARVGVVLQRVRDAEQDFRRIVGRELEGLDVLEIGPGQMLKYLRYFGIRNNAQGIDLDVVSDRLSPASVMNMLRVNGPMRTVKTMGRKMLGLDARFNHEMCRQLGVTCLPEPRVTQMDAERLTFADASFDFVYSCSTFEHLANPGAAIDEIQRVLRPGGVGHIMLHLYASDSGCHDPRISAGRRDELPYWSHLRPEHSSKVRGNAYLNKISLAQWRELFGRKVPNVQMRAVTDGDQARTSELARLREVDELKDYSDDELLTVDLVAMWQRG